MELYVIKLWLEEDSMVAVMWLKGEEAVMDMEENYVR